MEHIFLLIILLIIIIISLVIVIISEKNKYSDKLEYNTNVFSSQKEELEKKLSISNKEIVNLKNMLSIYEEKEYDQKGYYTTCEGPIKKEPIYEGKRALIGDYMMSSYNNTKKVLQSLGFTVDVETRMDDVIDRISYGNKYDIIFSNNIYPDGTGPELLRHLKSYQGFCTPMVVHTVSKNQKEYFVDGVGFNGYIEKPVTQKNLKPILKEIFKN